MLPDETELRTLQSVRLRTLGRALGDTVGVALAWLGQAVSQRGLWLVRGWIGARVDTRAPLGLEVLGRSVLLLSPPLLALLL